MARASVCCSLNERQVLILAEKLGEIIVVAIFLFGIVLRVKNGAIEEIKCLIHDDVEENVASKVWDEKGVSKRTRQLYRAIREACPDYLPLTEIALKVNRKLRYLKNNVIPDMVAMGLLERKYPNVPSHPDQQYRCADDE